MNLKFYKFFGCLHLFDLFCYTATRLAFTQTLLKDLFSLGPVFFEVGRLPKVVLSSTASAAVLPSLGRDGDGSEAAGLLDDGRCGRLFVHCVTGIQSCFRRPVIKKLSTRRWRRDGESLFPLFMPSFWSQEI